jgi:predicted transcriptional regulator
MTFAEFRSALEARGLHPTGNGQIAARCPAHEDKRASLSVSQGAKGILLHCHAGCSLEAITAALGLKVTDLFKGKPECPTKPRIVAVYDYHDEAGKLLFQVCRFDPKDFRQRAPNGAWSTKGIRRVPFHLPQLITAVKEGRPVYIAEGEKDVLALEAAGFAATCNPGGAGKWLPEFCSHLAGAEVIIIADKDGAGWSHAADVQDKLRDIAASVRVIELPDVNGKPVKDAADYFAAGGQPAELDELIQAEPTVTTDAWNDLIEDGADLQNRDVPAVVEIVEGILPEAAKLSIVSSAKCFKTWTTIYMALAISHGIEFLGRATVRRRVLYVNLELKTATFTRRWQAIAKALNITVDRSWFSHLPLRGRLSGLTLREIVTRIIKVAKAKRASVIVVDPLFKLNIEGEENSSRDQTVFCNELDRLTTEGQCTAVFNDHSGKGNQGEKEPLDVIRGSSAKGGDLDAAMVLRKHLVAECFRVDLVHRELPPVEPFVIFWDYPLMRLRPDLSAEDVKKPTQGRKKAHDPEMLCSAIADTTMDNPISVNAWAKAAGINRTTLNDYLQELRKKGWIMTVGEGNSARQCLTDKGREAAKRWRGEA